MSYFLFTNLSNMSVTSSGDNSEYSSTNLLDYNPRTKWVADSAGTNQYVQFDLGALTEVDSVVIENNNFDVVMVAGSGDLVLFQCADNAGFTVNVTSLVSFNPQVDSSTDALNIMYRTFATQTKRYFRIYYNGATDYAPYLGNVYIGKGLTFTHEYQFGYKKGNQSFNTVEKTSLRGITKTSQTSDGRLLYEVSFKWLNNTERQLFVDFVKRVGGKLYPFYFIDHDDIVRYVRFAEDYSPATIMASNINDLQTIRLKAVDVGLSLQEIQHLTMYGILEDEWITTVS